MRKTRQHITRSILGIVGGLALGYIIALDVTGWFFIKPSTLILIEIACALFLFRITHGLMEDERISTPVKRGYFWGVSALVLAHVFNMSYLYLKDLQALFDIARIDFAESLALGWLYFHLPIFGFIFGAVYDYCAVSISNRRKARRLKKLSSSIAKAEDE
jgi:chromate transport protein ChrA